MLAYCICVCLLDSVYMKVFVRLHTEGMACMYTICALVAASAFALFCGSGLE